MTTTVGPFGSSGIGLWFGLSALEWGRAALVKVTFLVAICMALVRRGVILFSPCCCCILHTTAACLCSTQHLLLLHSPMQMSFPIGLMSARFLLSWEDLRGCWVFVSLSIASCALPALLASLIRCAV